MKWWKVFGSYAMALVAAETAESAVALALADDEREGWRYGWCFAELETRPMPAEPVAEGVYSKFAE